MKEIWLVPPAALTLTAGEVHLWRTDLDRNSQEVQEFLATLSADEKARALRFYFQQHRQRFIVARGTLRRILGRYLDLAPAQVEFEYSPQGKPKLAASCNGKELQFNLSHSQGLALYGVARYRRIGVDLEYLRPMEEVEQLVKRFYSAREFAAISPLSPQEREKAFFRGWTAKEAYLKATGSGLGGGLDRVEVSLVAGTPLQLLSLEGNTEAASRWHLSDLPLHPDYIATVAVEGRNCHLKFWQG